MESKILSVGITGLEDVIKLDVTNKQVLRIASNINDSIIFLVKIAVKEFYAKKKPRQGSIEKDSIDNMAWNLLHNIVDFSKKAESDGDADNLESLVVITDTLGQTHRFQLKVGIEQAVLDLC